MTTEQTTYDGRKVFGDSGTPNIPITNLTNEGGQILAEAAETAARKHNIPIAGPGQVIKINSTGSSTHYDSLDPSDTTVGGNKNGAQLSLAAANVNDGDLVVIGPGLYITENLDWSGASSNFTLINHAQEIKRGNSKNAYYMMNFAGDDIDLFLGSGFIDGNRSNNLTDRVDTVNEHNGITLTGTGSRMRVFGGHIRNLGYLGVALECGALLQDGIEVHGLRTSECRGTHVRARRWMLKDCIFRDPFDMDFTDDVADQAAMLLLTPNKYEGAYRLDDRTFWMFTDDDATNDPTDITNWTNHSTQGQRHLVGSSSAGTHDCQLGLIDSCQFTSTHWGQLVYDPDSTVTKKLVFRNVFWKDEKQHETATGNAEVKVQYTEETRFEGCVFDSPSDRWLKWDSGGGTVLIENKLIIHDTWAGGVIDFDTVPSQSVEIINSDTGARDVENGNDGLEELNTRNLKIHNSDIGGGKRAAIGPDVTYPGDVWDIQGSRLSTVADDRSGSNYGVNAIGSSPDNDLRTNNITFLNNEMNARQSGFATAGGSSTITLPSNFSATVDIQKGLKIEVVRGPAHGDVRTVISSDGSRVCTVDTAWSATPTTDTFVRIYQYHYGQAVSATSTTIVLASDACDDNDIYINMEVEIVAGRGIGQTKTITAYNGTSKQCTVSAWTTDPDNTSKYRLKRTDATETYTSSSSADRLRLTGTPGVMRWNEDIGGGHGSATASDKHPTPNLGSATNFHATRGSPGEIIINETPPEDSAFPFSYWSWQQTTVGSWTTGAWVGHSPFTEGILRTAADIATDVAPNDDTTTKKFTIQRLGSDPTNAAFIKFSNSPGTPTNDFYLVLEEG